ncbi:MAG: hypothetical protein ACTSWK_04370 [Promethearchaeota archaeon]
MADVDTKTHVKAFYYLLVPFILAFIMLGYFVSNLWFYAIPFIFLFTSMVDPDEDKKRGGGLRFNSSHLFQYHSISYLQSKSEKR